MGYTKLGQQHANQLPIYCTISSASRSLPSLYKPNQFSISVLYDLSELGVHFHCKSPKGPQGNSLLVNTDHPPPNDSGVLVVLGFFLSNLEDMTHNTQHRKSSPWEPTETQRSCLTCHNCGLDHGTHDFSKKNLSPYISGWDS